MRDGSRHDLAIGYTRQGDSADLQSNRGMLPIRGCSAGSSSHTVADLFRFHRALISGKLLGPAWTRWYFEGTVGEQDALPAGWAARIGIGIGGGGPGVNAMLEVDGDSTVIVMCNLDPPAAGAAAKRLTEVFRN